MKTIFRTAFVVLVALVSMESVASAQLLKNILKQTTSATTTTVSAAYTQGQTAGTALKALYAQYKLDGKKLNMENANNLLNAASLASSVKGLRSSDLTYKKDYAKGLIFGSNSLVTDSNSSSVLSGLTSLANLNLSSLTENEALQAAASQALQEKASETLSSLLSNTKVSETAAKANEVATQASSTIENASAIASSVTSILNLFK
jgi:hypothetical protein